MDYKPLTTIAFVSMMTASSPALAQEIIAHRGASHQAPENTLAAVDLGYALGADAVEIDIHLSRDNQLMVIHDKDTRRTAGGRNMVVRETPSDDLRQLEVGSWKEEQYRGEKIPFLEEVLARVPEGRKLVIELKTGPESLPYLQQKIVASGIAERLILISFDREAIVQAKELFPGIPAYWLLHSWDTYSPDKAIRIAKEARLEGLNVQYKLVDSAFMQKMKAAKLEVYVYTVNDAAAAKKLAALGVKAITTDRPAWLRDQLRAGVGNE